MIGNDRYVVGALDWVLILAPYRRDGPYLETLLTEHGLLAKQCPGGEDLTGWMGQAPGVIVATHEALNPAVIQVISEFLRGQPNWSELPIVVLLDRASPDARIRAELDAAWPGSRRLFYKRPVSSLELISGIQSALLVRLRQRDVRDYLDRETELRHELNHRVKNILASVSSIFQMTRRGSRSTDELARDFEGRLAALADVHSAVFVAGGESVRLTAVVELTFRPYRAGGEARVSVAGPDIMVTREAGTTIALCLHELTTNAIKYGALKCQKGKVDFQWTVTGGSDPVLALQWIESGGPPVSEPSGTGYGTRYVRFALASLFGQPPLFVFSEDGLRCTVSGPFSRVRPKA